MSTNACQKHADLQKSSKKSAKRNHAIKKKKHSRWRQKRKSRSRGNQQNNRGSWHSTHPISSRELAMESRQRDPAASFWKNYQGAMEWQNKHFINYWKSRCAALELENQHLYKTLETLTTPNSSEYKPLEPQTNGGANFEDNEPEVPEGEEFVEDEGEDGNEQNEDVVKEEEIEADEGGDEDCEESEEFTFVIDEGMLEFLETSVKHKMEQKKKRDAEMELEASEELVIATEKMKLPRVIMEERRNEMAKLYGAESAPMILGMETAMQLNFDRFVGKFQPKHWPNLPLNL